MPNMYAPPKLVGRELLTKTLRTTDGIFAAPQHITARKVNAKGKFLQFLPGHGGDVIAVTHKWGIAVYDLREVQFVKPTRLEYSRQPRKAKKRQAWQYQQADGQVVTAQTWTQLKRVLPEKIFPSNLKNIQLPKPYRKSFFTQ